MRAAPDPEDLADSRGWLDKPRLRQEDETLRNMHLMLPDGDLPAAVFRAGRNGKLVDRAEGRLVDEMRKGAGSAPGTS